MPSQSLIIQMDYKMNIFNIKFTGTKLGGHRFLSATMTIETIGVRSSSISGFRFNTCIKKLFYPNYYFKIV